jgi:hypothetical protein
MRINDDLRKDLKVSKIRRQDAAIVLHCDEQLKKRENPQFCSSRADLQAQVKAVFSESRPVPERVVDGIINLATNISTEVLESMVQSPINMPSWLFNRSISSLLRLSSTFQPNSPETGCFPAICL